MMVRPAIQTRVIGPASVAFIGSLLLSFVAIQGSAILNRDGMLYIDTARSLLEQGFTRMPANFDWPFLPLLIASLGYVAQTNLESVAHFLDALFMAGTCALMVDLIRRRMPGAAWIACLVVLAVPAYNGYRDYLLREFGYWFFSVLALWLASRWEESEFRWHEAIACQMALVCAVLFRFEAIVFFPALVMWQLFSAPVEKRVARTVKIVALPLAMGIMLLVLLATGLVRVPSRVTYYLDAATMFNSYRFSESVAKLLASGVLPDYSKEEAGYILFFGLLSVIPVKLVGKFGLLAVPFFYSLLNRPARATLGRWQLAGWMFAAHLSALIAFVTYQSFLSGRYVSMLNLLAVPVVVTGLLRLIERYPRWKMIFLVPVFVVMLANVVSLSPQKTHVPAAGAWLAEHHPDPARVCMDNARIAYYAGWVSSGTEIYPFDPARLLQALASGECDLLVLTESRKESVISGWVAANRLQLVMRFTNKAGDAVLIIAAAQP